jgi:hypothetical protein
MGPEAEIAQQSVTQSLRETPQTEHLLLAGIHPQQQREVDLITLPHPLEVSLLQQAFNLLDYRGCSAKD